MFVIQLAMSKWDAEGSKASLDYSQHGAAELHRIVALRYGSAALADL
jgi:hypothetical protein